MLQSSNTVGSVERDTNDYVSTIRGSQASLRTTAGVHEGDRLDDEMEKRMDELTLAEDFVGDLCVRSPDDVVASLEEQECGNDTDVYVAVTESYFDFSCVVE